MSASEQTVVGDAIDLRGTVEGKQRFLKIHDMLSPAAKRLAMEELGIHA